MPSNNRNDAILLLTVSFGNSDDASASAKPLSIEEWSRFAAWLRERGMQPQDLMRSGLEGMLAGWSDRAITVPRIDRLLHRGGALALRMAKWEGAGVRAITRADEEYPSSFKERLRSKSPPVLFVSGNVSLLNASGVAVVGSRNAAEEDCQYTSAFAAHAAARGLSVVSGGARGVDQSAMFGALQGEGTAVGVLSNSLLTESSSAKYRRHIMAGDLTLVSPFNPETGFSVGKAMGRNACIYCLAHAAVVIDCDFNKGGTWRGAVENLKTNWVPLWVKHSNRPGSGNSELIRRGARWLPEEFPDLPALFRSQLSHVQAQFSGLPTSPTANANQSEGVPDGLQYYDLFLKHMERITIDKPLRSEEIAEAIEIRRVQVNDWLKRGVEEKRVEKLTRKPLYRYWKSKSLLIGD